MDNFEKLMRFDKEVRVYDEKYTDLNEFLYNLISLLKPYYIDENEDAVMKRYGDAANIKELSLCCPVNYSDKGLHDYIPVEVLDIDYGCGDPTVYAKEGETVLDLGSGSGKHCFMIAKKVGENGRVIGVDMTQKMLDVSRNNSLIVSKNLKYKHNICEFKKASIEFLDYDLDYIEDYISKNIFNSYEDLKELFINTNENKLIKDNSTDLIVSNCVLNLSHNKTRLFEEMYRVSKIGARLVISDIVSDKDFPNYLEKDNYLWSGCISGAMRQDRFLEAFRKVGFYGMQIVKSYQWMPLINGVEVENFDGVRLYSITVIAYKGKKGPCYETNRVALYNGPFSRVYDDDDHEYLRSIPINVCEKTANILSKEPYEKYFDVSVADKFLLKKIDEKKPVLFDCSSSSSNNINEIMFDRNKSDVNNNNNSGKNLGFKLKKKKTCDDEGCC